MKPLLTTMPIPTHTLVENDLCLPSDNTESHDLSDPVTEPIQTLNHTSSDEDTEYSQLPV